MTFLHGAGLNAHTWDTTILALGLPALAIDLPGHGDSSWRADAAYIGARARPRCRCGDGRLDRRPAAARRAVARRPHRRGGRGIPTRSRPRARRHRHHTRASTRTPARRRSASSSPARPTGPSRDELVDRALALRPRRVPRRPPSAACTSTRGCAPDGRVEWKHHFAHLSAAMSRAAGVPGAVDAAGRESPTPSRTCCPASRMGGSGRRDRADHPHPWRARLRHGGGCREFRERVPAASVVVVPSGHNVQEEEPVDARIAACGNWRGRVNACIAFRVAARRARSSVL